MREFFDIARTDFVETFGGAWIFPIFLFCTIWIIWREQDWIKKILFGILPLVFLAVYWCPFTGMLFIKILGEDVYWRILWLILLAATIPYGFCLLIKETSGMKRYLLFLVCMAAVGLGGKKVLSEEWFEPSTNVYKVPQNVIEVCELMPDHVHAIVSNRLMPYIRMYNPEITLEYGRNALAYNGIEDTESHEQLLYLEAQKEEIDLNVLLPLAREVNVTCFVLSNNRTYVGAWEDYGYEEYGRTDEFTIFLDENCE